MRETMLITGASSGIGLAIAKQAATMGYHLVVASRNVQKLNLLKSELESQYKINVQVFQADLSQINQAQKLYYDITESGIEIDILVNNAGVGIYGDFDKTNLEDERNMINLNISSLVTLTKLFLPGMKAKNKGNIVNISSIVGHFPMPYYTVYAATKAFVQSFSEGLDMELQHTGVKVTSVCPGPTETAFFTEDMKNTNSAKQMGFDTAETVAQVTLNAILKRKSTVIVGIHNTVPVMAYRFSPKFISKKIFSFMAKQSGKA